MKKLALLFLGIYATCIYAGEVPKYDCTLTPEKKFEVGSWLMLGASYFDQETVHQLALLRERYLNESADAGNPHAILWRVTDVATKVTACGEKIDTQTLESLESQVSAHVKDKSDLELANLYLNQIRAGKQLSGQ